MTIGVSIVVFIPLLAISLAHFVWSFGGSWPIRDREYLAKAVIGRPGVERVPRLMSLLVALTTLAAGVVALALADPVAGGLPLTLTGSLISGVFFARGIAGYMTQWREWFPLEPFATLDRQQYSPLCLIIGAGFAILVILRLI